MIDIDSDRFDINSFWGISLISLSGLLGQIWAKIAIFLEREKERKIGKIRKNEDIFWQKATSTCFDHQNEHFAKFHEDKIIFLQSYRTFTNFAILQDSEKSLWGSSSEKALTFEATYAKFSQNMSNMMKVSFRIF